MTAQLDFQKLSHDHRRSRNAKASEHFYYWSILYITRWNCRTWTRYEWAVWKIERYIWKSRSSYESWVNILSNTITILLKLISWWSATNQVVRVFNSHIISLKTKLQILHNERNETVYEFSENLTKLARLNDRKFFRL